MFCHDGLEQAYQICPEYEASTHYKKTSKLSTVLI